jgi:tyrosyl-tRNA synthetase
MPTQHYMNANTNILKLRHRGLLRGVFPDDRTLELQNALIGSPQTVYCGFDPTADSLHIGNLLAIIALLHCHRAGHHTIAVVGGATSLIGDPSGRSTERQPLDSQTVERNLVGIRENIQRIFDNHQDWFTQGQKSNVSPLKILDNSEWYRDRDVISFLCNVGRYFRMGTMLSRHSVETRLKSAEGMSLAEFLYQVFQAYDWLYLCQKYSCTIQIGGSDQLGNIVSGYELITRVTKTQVYGVTLPLITNTAGDKLGKSAGNAVWLSADKTSAFDFYQYFIRVTDTDVKQYLQLFTFLSDEQIENIVLKHKANPEKRTAQKKLAEEVTQLVHGTDGLQSAQRCTEALYSGTADQLAHLSENELTCLFKNATTCQLFLDPGTTLFDLVMKAKCFRHESDADRVIAAGGVYVNGSRMVEARRVLTPGEHILPNNITLLRIGKKNYYIVKWLGMT